jgi:hypothetical protein
MGKFDTLTIFLVIIAYLGLGLLEATYAQWRALTHHDFTNGAYILVWLRCILAIVTASVAFFVRRNRTLTDMCVLLCSFGLVWLVCLSVSFVSHFIAMISR